MKSGNDLRIFRDGMYHVREVLIDLQHAYDPECVAAAKVGLEALQARIVKDARAEIFKKMRQEVINPVVNPIWQEVADGFGREAKSRWVLSEEQIREKIANGEMEPVIQELVLDAITDGLEASRPEGVASGSDAIELPDMKLVSQKIEEKLTKKFGEKVAKIVAAKV